MKFVFPLTATLLLTGITPVLAQTVLTPIGQKIVKVGGTTTFNLSLVSSSNPTNLNWTITYPPTNISSLTVVIAPGLTQHIFSTYSKGTVKCTLSGLDSSVIPAGVIAQVIVKLATHNSSSAIHIINTSGEDVLGSSLVVIGVDGRVCSGGCSTSGICINKGPVCGPR